MTYRGMSFELLPTALKAAEADVEQTWREFWADIVLKDGRLDLAQVKRELHDFRFLIQSVPKVYDAATGGRISKANTLPEAVIGEFHALLERERQEAIEDDRDERGDLAAATQAVLDRVQAELCATRANLTQARADLEAETAACRQLEAERDEARRAAAGRAEVDTMGPEELARRLRHAPATTYALPDPWPCHCSDTFYGNGTGRGCPRCKPTSTPETTR
jgi:hypothetical protein